MPSIYKRSVQALQQYQYTIGIALSLFTIMFILSSLAPFFSDDVQHALVQGYGIKTAFTWYMQWNARIGELLLVLGVASWSATAFDIANSLVFTIFMFSYFFLIFGSIPCSSRAGAFEDTLRMMLLCILLYSFTVFGAVFLWRAGALNYGWSMCILALYCIPYRIFLTPHLQNTLYATSMFQKIAFYFYIMCIGIIAGMTSEHGVATILGLHILGFFFAIYKKVRLPLWYYIGFICLMLGFACLYFAAGPNIRLHSPGNYYQQFYISLSDLFHLPWHDFFLRCYKAISTAIHRNRTLVSYFVGCFSIMLLCSYTNKDTKYKQKFIRARNIALIIAFVWICTALSLIQLLEIPKRARFFQSLLLIGSMSIMIEYIGKRFPKKIYAYAVIGFFLYTTESQIIRWAFYSAEYNTMIRSIIQQKQEGIMNVIVDNPTEYKHIGGDWDRITKDPEKGNNTAYARYYGVHSVSARE